MCWWDTINNLILIDSMILQWALQCSDATHPMSQSHTSIVHNIITYTIHFPFEKHCNASLGHKWVSLGRVQVGRGRGMGGMGSFRAVMQDGSARAAGIYSSHQLLRQAFILQASSYTRRLFFKPAVTPGFYSSSQLLRQASDLIWSGCKGLLFWFMPKQSSGS